MLKESIPGVIAQIELLSELVDDLLWLLALKDLDVLNVLASIEFNLKDAKRLLLLILGVTRLVAWSDISTSSWRRVKLHLRLLWEGGGLSHRSLLILSKRVGIVIPVLWLSQSWSSSLQVILLGRSVSWLTVSWLVEHSL